MRWKYSSLGATVFRPSSKKRSARTLTEVFSQPRSLSAPRSAFMKTQVKLAEHHRSFHVCFSHYANLAPIQFAIINMI